VANATDLMVRLYGHDVSASKALKDVGKEAETVSGKMKHIGKAAAVGFAAVGAAALAFAGDSLKAAAHEQKAQAQLAQTLKNTTHATKEQITSANEWVEKQRSSAGLAAGPLQQGLARLVRSTHDLSKAQKLGNLASQISVSTGKDYFAVSNALAKANDGNAKALVKLGISLGPQAKNFIEYQKVLKQVSKAQENLTYAQDSYGKNSPQAKKATEKLNEKLAQANTLASEGTDIFGELGKGFAGSVAANAATLTGKMERLHQNLEIAKEKIGTALLPIVTKFAQYILEHVVPNIQAFVDGLTGKDGATDGIGKAYKGVHDFGEKIREVFKWLADHKHIVVEVAAAMAAFWATGKIGSALSVITRAFGTVKTALIGVEEVAVGTAAAEDAAAGPGAPALMAAQAAAAAAVFAAFGMSDMWHGIFGPKYKPGKGATGNTFGAKGKTETLEVPGASLGPHGELPPGAQPSADKYKWDPVAKKWYQLLDNGGKNYNVYQKNTTGHASGGAVAAGTQIMVGENGPELFTPTSGGSITPHNLVGGSGMSVHIHVAGSVIHEKDLAVTVRDNIAQLMRRRGLNPAILGV